MSARSDGCLSTVLGMSAWCLIVAGVLTLAAMLRGCGA